jgi:excisionase family DNA binding protein
MARHVLLEHDMTPQDPQQQQRRRHFAHTIPQVANGLNISQRHVWRLIGAGKIKTIKLGPRSTRVTDDEYERLVTEGVQ